ncbi:MAG: hypothetical protein FWE42_06365 [Defluviitaleaceae bacterium]|nr:hypothetical protein [Defluviitaleaceae bacterium]
MDKLIADLLNIEQAASQSMDALEEERTAQIARTADEITRRNMEIKRKADKELQALKQEAEETTQAKLAEIECKYKEKTLKIRQLFDGNGSTWRKEWANRILGIE